MSRINRQAIRDGSNAVHNRLQGRAIGAATQNATSRQAVPRIRDAHVKEKEPNFFHHLDTTYCNHSLDLRTMPFSLSMKRWGNHSRTDDRDPPDLTDRLGYQGSANSQADLTSLRILRTLYSHFHVRR